MGAETCGEYAPKHADSDGMQQGLSVGDLERATHQLGSMFLVEEQTRLVLDALSG